MLLQCWILLIQVSCAAGAWSSRDEKSIRETIFSKTNYDYLTRPTEVTNVSVMLNLLAINTLDIKTQHLSCTGWLSMEWIDSRLTWNMTSGTESKYVFAKNKEIWFPEIFIDNSLADVNVINNDDLLYKVRYDGSVMWEIPRIFTTYCEVDITYFPFDTQTCTIELTSWAYNTNQVMLHHLDDQINTEDFKLHAEFLLKKTLVSSSDLHETLSDGSIEHFSQLEFHIILERRPSYYIMSMIVPVVLNSYLMVIVFVLPVDSGEKVGFSLTVFLAVAVMLTMILDQMPSTALYVSILSMFLLSNLVLNVVEVFLTVIVITTHHRSTEVPGIVDSLTRCMARASCWNGCKAAKGSYELEQTEESDVQENDIGRKIKIAFEERVIPVTKYKYSWEDVSMILDWFLFTYSLALTTAMTLVYMMALSIGGTINA